MRLTYNHDGCNQIKACGNALCKETCEKYNNCKGCPIAEAIDKLADYERKEENGLMLPAPLHGVESFKMPGAGVFYLMPCMVGDDIYCIYERETECTKHHMKAFADIYCDVCQEKECDSRIEMYISHEKVPSLEWLVTYRDKFGKTIFLTEEEAEQALKQLGE